MSPQTPIMLRNVFIVLVLAAFAATSAVASPDRSVTAHRHVTTQSASNRTPHFSSSQSHRRVAAPKTNHQAYRPVTHPPARRAARRRTSPTRSRPRQLPFVQRPDIASRAGRPVAVPASLHRRTTAFMSSPLKGSLESLTRQNEMAESEGLERILDEDDLNDRIAQKLLVPVPALAGLTIDARLPENRRYCRQWTADFLSDLARAHASQFRHPLFVSSAVRTVEFQKQLIQINGNAASAEGDIVSPHITGSTIDIAKTGMNRQELAWMRAHLLTLQLAAQIDVEEEFQQACFHITVYKSYVTPAPGPTRRLHRRPSPAAVDIASHGR